MGVVNAYGGNVRYAGMNGEYQFVTVNKDGGNVQYVKHGIKKFNYKCNGKTIVLMGISEEEYKGKRG